MTATVRLAEALIARPSVTPVDEGCQALMAERLQAIGFECQTLVFGPATPMSCPPARSTNGPAHLSCPATVMSTFMVVAPLT